ncbi:MBL fold metallo-hydrolase [Candidatus Bipolaricaulota bacterium]
MSDLKSSPHSGHASHHICLFEHNSRMLFAGDAAGNWNNPVDVPLTVPPRFDLAKALAESTGAFAS